MPPSLPILRVGLLAVALICLGSGPGRAEEAFPRPTELEPDVQFWLRVYTQVGTDGGLIHDSRHLDVVYDVVSFPKKASRRTRERMVERAKHRYRDALRSLGRGRRSGLSREEARILALWGGSPDNETLRAAASRVRFQLGQADKFREGLIRSGAWRDYIRKTFAEMGLPTELAALPHVESSFSPHAYSRVGAAGLWQFTRSTGRRYMRVDHVVDERMDPFAATIAAARLLEHNHRATGTWPLALTSYNHGAAGMRRAARKMGTTDIGVINRRYRSRTFGFASRNFYPEFLAALEIDRNPEKFFGPLPAESPPDDEIYELPFYVYAKDLARAVRVDLEVLREANPSLLGSVWNGSKRIPKGFPLRIPRIHLDQPVGTLVAAIPSSAQHARQTRDTYHKVRRGETLSAIAARYHTSVRTLQALNNLRSKHRIRAGQRLRLPTEGGSHPAPVVAKAPAPAPVVAKAPAPAPVVAEAPTPEPVVAEAPTPEPVVAEAPTPEPAPEDGTYRVRRGDNLAAIAARFGVTEQDLLEWNPIRNRHRIAIGQVLRVSSPGVSSEPAEPVVLASIEPPLHPEDTSEFTEPPSPEADFEAEAPPLDPTTEVDSVADAAAAELAQGSPAAEALLADPGDYSVAADGTIEVQAAETLGHFAEWLDVRASRLRELNHMRYGTPLAIGDRLRLDLSQVSKQTFEERRLEHHRALQGEFFERYAIDGTRTHVVRPGDSIWQIAQREYDVPLWLIRQYNPDVNFADLHAGETIAIPHVKPR